MTLLKNENTNFLSYFYADFYCIFYSISLHNIGNLNFVQYKSFKPRGFKVCRPYFAGYKKYYFLHFKGYNLATWPLDRVGFGRLH
jgi:hypothetical protein